MNMNVTIIWFIFEKHHFVFFNIYTPGLAPSFNYKSIGIRVLIISIYRQCYWLTQNSLIHIILLLQTYLVLLGFPEFDCCVTVNITDST